MDPRTEVEFEAFIRWLAMNPTALRRYLQGPEAFLEGARLSPGALAAVREAGPAEIARLAEDKADEIYNAPEAARPSTFNRDPTVSGYGRKPTEGV